MDKRTVVVHSGGMDSSLCLAIAKKEYGKENVLSLSFDYGQCHIKELNCARKICQDWAIDHAEIDLTCLGKITSNALTDSAMAAVKGNTLVLGRNGLMAHLAAIYAHSINAGSIYMGVMQLEAEQIGYRDCSDHYMELTENVLRIDLDNPSFKINRPLIHMSKEQSFLLAKEYGILDYLWKNTISCYKGLPEFGCGCCPACGLRNPAYLAVR